MRILYSFPHQVGVPGIGTTALNQVLALSETGADVTLVCTSLHAALPPAVRVHETLRLRGRRVPHRAFGSPLRARNFHDAAAARFLRTGGEAFDVVHTWPQGGLRTMRAARMHGVLASREVPNTHTANAFEEAAREAATVGVGLPRGHSHRPDAHRLRLETDEYDAADLLMVPSAHVARTFRDRGTSVEKLRRHQYGYDPSRFHTVGRTETPARPFTAVFVGRAEPRKGLHYALQAWSAARPPAGARFLVAGGFADGYRERLERHLGRDSVEALGFVDDVPGLLRRSDVLLLPSVEEGSALVTYEAQASGCIPLVSTATGALLPPGLRDLVHEPRSVGTLTDHLARVMHGETERRELREECVTWSAELTWRHAARRMVDIYRAELVGS
ncbi:glycosyltransferase family 4 protein [Nocardioides xinjiangensis]|uniref:glycosyltransferase family 4 protein n=1 Tax=Nocardioides xinjiangensis TaxID=2817376 RepID=UPI001B316DE1|nr:MULTISPECIES: glycosyltransferase family 4 protein [unclassified Nocardioides]